MNSDLILLMYLDFLDYDIESELQEIDDSFNIDE